jgi:hypothetical protein
MAELGFDVTGIRGQAAKAAALGDDLRAVQSTWETGTGSAAQALGLDVLVSAFGAMREAWVEQFTVYIDVVSKLTGHLGIDIPIDPAEWSAWTAAIRNLIYGSIDRAGWLSVNRRTNSSRVIPSSSFEARVGGFEARQRFPVGYAAGWWPRVRPTAVRPAAVSADPLSKSAFMRHSMRNVTRRWVATCSIS